MENFENMTAIGKALIDQIQKLAAEGRIPQVDITTLKTPDELMAYLKAHVYKQEEPAAPKENAKPEQAEEPGEAAFRPLHVFHVTRVAPVEAQPDQDADSIISILKTCIGELDSLNRAYYDLYRTRNMVHAIRDIPDLNDPMHLANVVDCSNQLFAIQQSVLAQTRILSAIAVTYECFDEGKDLFTQAMGKANELLRRTLPLHQMLENKLDDTMGEGWFIFDDEDDEDDTCDTCPGCTGDCYGCCCGGDDEDECD